MKKTYLYAGVSIFCWSTVATVCWVTALKKGNTANISNLAYITPFVSSIWTALFLKEKITVNLMAGLTLIILGIFIQLRDNKSE